MSAARSQPATSSSAAGKEPPIDPAVGVDLATVDVLSVLQALSDPVRLEIVRQLTECPRPGGLTCGQIEVPVGKSTATHHLKTLLNAGITTEREEGTRKFVRLRREELDERFPGLIDLVIREGITQQP